MYTFKAIPEEDREIKVFANFSELPHYEILDDNGDQIAVVHSETEAEALVSHLNR